MAKVIRLVIVTFVVLQCLTIVSCVYQYRNYYEYPSHLQITAVSKRRSSSSGVRNYLHKYPIVKLFHKFTNRIWENVSNKILSRQDDDDEIDLGFLLTPRALYLGIAVLLGVTATIGFVSLESENYRRRIDRLEEKVQVLQQTANARAITSTPTTVFPVTRLLVAGGTNAASGNVDLIDLTTGNQCKFHATTSFSPSTLANGFGTYFPSISKAVLCQPRTNPGVCATSTGTADWNGNEVTNEPFNDRTENDVSVLVNSGQKWIHLDKKFGVNQVELHELDPATLEWKMGDTININLGTFPQCMTALSETKLVFISSGDRKMYTYDTGTKALVEVGTIPFASQGSCRKIVRDDGVTIVVIFPGSVNPATTAARVYLWNTATNAVTTGPQYLVHKSRMIASAIEWEAQKSILFTGGDPTGNFVDPALYKFTLDNGFEKITDLTGGNRNLMVLIPVPSNFACTSGALTGFFRTGSVLDKKVKEFYQRLYYSPATVVASP